MGGVDSSNASTGHRQRHLAPSTTNIPLPQDYQACRTGFGMSKTCSFLFSSSILQQPICSRLRLTTTPVQSPAILAFRRTQQAFLFASSQLITYLRLIKISFKFVSSPFCRSHPIQNSPSFALLRLQNKLKSLKIYVIPFNEL